MHGNCCLAYALVSRACRQQSSDLAAAATLTLATSAVSARGHNCFSGPPPPYPMSGCPFCPPQSTLSAGPLFMHGPGLPQGKPSFARCRLFY